MTREEFESLCTALEMVEHKVKAMMFRSHDAAQRALIEQQAQEIAELTLRRSETVAMCTQLEGEIARLRGALEFVAGEASFLSEAEAVAKQALKEEHP